MPDFGALNFVNVGPNGTFRRSGDLETKPADIDALFTHLRDTNADKLTVHFHGGLIKESAGGAIARKMWELFKDDAHPVTFVWETGLIETVTRNLESLYGTKLYQKVVKYVIRHAGKRLGGSVGARGPGEPMSMNEIQAELRAVKPFDQYDEGARGAAELLDEAEIDAAEAEIEVDIEQDLEADAEVEEALEDEAPQTELLDPALVAEIEADAGRGIISTAVLARKLAAVVLRVLKRFVRKRDHGFYPTVVEETLRELYLADLGAWVWSGMKDAAEKMWDENTGPITQQSHVGAYFLDRLSELQQERPLTIDLVGHSAGSIAICHMLRTAAARHPDLAIRNILFLAPACTMDLFRENIVTKPERYRNFRMFTMGDDLEKDDQLVPFVYTRSLLYLISGVLEKDEDHLIAGLELQLRGADPYDTPELDTVSTFLRAPGENRLVLSETKGAGNGLNSASHKHGDFDDDPDTRASLQSIVAS